VTFRAVRADSKAEFAASTDTWFRPVNFVNAPDGTLHVLDMYRETIEHPWSIPDDIRSRLDLRSGEDKGRIYRLTPPGFRHRPTPRLSEASTAELVALLDHPNGWHRDTAHRLLFECQDRAAVVPLQQLLRASKNPLGRLQALYSLDGLKALDDDDLQAGLTDESPHVREHAVLLAERRLSRALMLRNQVLRLAEDADIRVRFQVALTLGTMTPAESTTAALAAIARRDGGDPWIRTALLSSAIKDPAGLFERLISEPVPGAPPLLRALALVIGAQGRKPEIHRVLAALAAIRKDEGDLVLDVTTGLGDGLARSANLASQGRKLTDLETQELPAETRIFLDRIFARATSLAAAESAPSDLRARGVVLLGQGRFETARACVGPLLDPQQPPEVEAAAVRALASFDRPEVAGLLLAPWKGYTPALRTEVVAHLLGRRVWIAPLLGAIEAGLIPPGQIPPARRALLLKDRDPALRARAAALLGSEAPGPRAEAIARYKPLLEQPGDAERGRLIFERECLACHTLGVQGHAVGPNLAGVRRRTAEEVLVNILDPNREASPEFHEYTVALDDGRVLTGLVAAETPASVTLRGRDAVEQTILRRNVAEIASTGKSLMPEGLEKTITPAEMKDLITFLLKLQD
jgi:putative heme-binding domain-containing protein